MQLASSQPLGSVIRNLVTGVASLVIAFTYSWNLSLVILATVPISALVLSYMSSRMQPNIDGQQIAQSQATKVCSSAIQNIETVKCFNAQDFESRKYIATFGEAAKWYVKQVKNNAAQIGFVRFMILAMFVQGFWYGYHLVSSGKRSPGTVITTFWSCLSFTEAIEQILPHLLVLDKGRSAGGTLRTILAQSLPRPGMRKRSIDAFQGGIIFNQVRYIRFVLGRTSFNVGPPGISFPN